MGNIPSEYSGILYHSKREADYAHQLDLEKCGKLIKDWERQVRFSLDVNGIHICNVIVDFVITYRDGRKEIREVKGFATDVWRMKWKLLEALYGDEYEMKVIK